MYRLLILFLFVLVGCRDVYPCDGSIVLVQPSELLDVVGHDKIKVGIHYWDEYGCKFRTKDELTPFELSRTTGPVLHINEWYQTSKDFAGMYYDAYPSKIMMSPNLFEDDYPANCAEETVAHETGHAMGMDHVYPPTGESAVMQPSENCIAAPTKYDYDAWCRLWCEKRIDIGDRSN